MSVPRLCAFAALLVLNRSWNLARFDLPLKGFGKAALLGLPPMALWIFYFSGSDGEAFSPFMKFLGLVTSLIVGLFEEYAFRGPLLFALRQRLSLFSTIAVSNVLFAAYHVQAEPVRFWPVIFLTGVIYANLRFRGLSLGWLAIIHGVTDAFYFVFPDINPDIFGFYGLVLQGGLLIYAVATFPWDKVFKVPSNGKLEAGNEG